MQDKPDFHKAYTAANDILVSARAINKFPFDADALIREQTDIEFCSYEKAAEYGIDIRTFGSESAVLIELGGMYIIFYNDKEPIARQKFSKLHEFGHYILKHDLNATGNLYDKQEIETNFFTAQILMPEQIMQEFVKRQKYISPQFLAGTFGVSEEALRSVSGVVVDVATREETEPVIEQVEDRFAYKTGDTLTAGKTAMIHGRNLRIAGNDNEVGVFFALETDGNYDTSGSGWIQVKESQLGTNLPRTLDFNLPAGLQSGKKYRLIIKTASSAKGKRVNKTVRATVYDKAITVA